MIADIAFKKFGADPLIKRNLLKTFSWRLAGSIDTVLLGWFITGNISFGARIGSTELLTKILLYYFHERIWQSIKVGLPSRHQQNKDIKNENRPHLFNQTGRITKQDREYLNGNPSFTFWFTGLSGSGKSTLATELEAWMFEQGLRVYILDGDNTRLGINSDLSFSDEDRTENIRRVAEISKLFNDAGIIVIASFISPFVVDRTIAKNLIGINNFIEAYTDSSVEICSKRDTKGLYKLAVEGKIKNFTGISSFYEPPTKPNIRLQTDKMLVEDCLIIIKEYLVTTGKVIVNSVY